MNQNYFKGKNTGSCVPAVGVQDPAAVEAESNLQVTQVLGHSQGGHPPSPGPEDPGDCLTLRGPCGLRVKQQETTGRLGTAEIRT